MNNEQETRNNIQPFNFSTLQPFNFSTLQPFNPSTLQLFNPSTLKPQTVLVYLTMPGYRLNRSAFKAQTVEEAADHISYYKKMTWQERLRVSAYLNSVAFNYPLHEPPRMDKTKFTSRKRNA